MRLTIKVIPKEGLQVRGPDGTVLPREGMEVERSSWWIRRERDGEVTILRDEPTSEAPKKKKEA